MEGKGNTIPPTFHLRLFDMRSLVLTLGTNQYYQEMIQDNLDRHQAYCSKWDMNYVPLYEATSNGDESRILPVISGLESGKYSHVFWVDCDAVILDMNQDLRGSVTDSCWLGMRKCAYPWAGKPWHWQTGVFYVQACPEALEYFQAVLMEMRRNPGFGADQTAMLNVLWYDPKYATQVIVNDLDCSWNYMPHIDKEQRDPPVIVAFHGAANRREGMADWVRRYPI